MAYYNKVEERLRSIPGVDAVGSINTLPLAKGPTLSFKIEGRAQLSVDQWPFANYRSVSPDYFRTLRIPVVQGRSFEERDDTAHPLIVLINQAAADDDFPNDDPVGIRISFRGNGPQQSTGLV